MKDRSTANTHQLRKLRRSARERRKLAHGLATNADESIQARLGDEMLGVCQHGLSQFGTAQRSSSGVHPVSRATYARQLLADFGKTARVHSFWQRDAAYLDHLGHPKKIAIQGPSPSFQALCAIAGHGALYLVWKTAGTVRSRSATWARAAWLAVPPLWVLTTLATYWVQPEIFKNLVARPWSLIFVVVMLGGLGGVFHFRRRGRELAAFLASGAFILGILAATMMGIYPCWLRSTLDPDQSITVANSAAASYGLRVALYWWTIGITLVGLYFAYVFRTDRGKVGTGDEVPGY